MIWWIKKQELKWGLHWHREFPLVAKKMKDLSSKPELTAPYRSRGAAGGAFHLHPPQINAYLYLHIVILEFFSPYLIWLFSASVENNPQQWRRETARSSCRGSIHWEAVLLIWDVDFITGVKKNKKTTPLTLKQPAFTSLCCNTQLCQTRSNDPECITF